MDPGGALEAPEVARHTAVALDLTDGESLPSPARIPRRIRRRFLESRSTSPASVAEIEAKLRDANLRRQQFHEWLSSKARSKPRSPSWSSQEDYPGQRLEAKLVAAEQKRLNLLANAQMRLARLDEIRQAAKSGAKMRFEKEREELGTRVESRVQQAKENRIRLLKAHMQRRAAIQERSARSLLQRINQDNRYKECVRSAIFQKRTAAEKKRMVLLEEEKKRAHAKVIQARRIAKTVCHQRETERRRMKEQLENRLQKAKRQRAEFLKQRRSPRNSAQINFIRHGEHLSRQLARCWRSFVTFRRTTFALAKLYDALGLNVKSVKHMPFEQVALLIESTTTLQTAKTLLERLETRSSLLMLSDSSNLENIDHLLKRVASPNIKVSTNRVVKQRVGKKIVGVSESIISETKMSRYPVRLVLCAYMILGHPNAVFSGHGEREAALKDSVVNFIQRFELLVKIILNGPSTAHSLMQSNPNDSPLDSHNKSSSGLPSEQSFRCQLRLFDSAWCSYLYRFVVWKVKDARSLEEDLVRAACQLELSMMQTCKMTAEGKTFDLSHDMKAIKKQVIEDQKLLREKVQHLSGNAGIERMECALSDARSKFFEAKGNSSPLANPVSHIMSPSVPHSLAKQMDSKPRAKGIEEEEGPKHVAQSLFGVSLSTQLNFGSEALNIDIQSSSARGKQLSTENELLVNEIMHWVHGPFADNIDMVQAEELKIQVKETMERAFWDGILDSLKKDIPDYNRLLSLMKEVRDELCDLAPQSWKQDILSSIDLDILSQVLESGLQYTDYLGNVLEYVLVVLQKLSAPTSEEAMRKEHQKLLSGLADITRSNNKLNQSFVITAIKGLRFVLNEIQTLKKEVSLARIKLMEPIIKGSAGLEYLQTSFTNRYGSPLDAANTLPQTIQWLSLVSNNLAEEWSDHIDSCSVFSASHGVPVAALRTGAGLLTSSKRQDALFPSTGNLLHTALPKLKVWWPFEEQFTDNAISNSHCEGGVELPECSGAKVDKLVRIGLLNLATAIEGVTPESVPETFKLNVSRLRNVQSQFQQIIVTATSILVIRQVLSEKSVASSELEAVVTTTVRRLCELLKSSADVGIKEITEIMMSSSSSYSDSSSETKLQSRKEMIARMLSKSLQNDDAVFRMVSRSSYLALRAIVLGGCGSKGRKLADAALRRIGAGMLLEEVVDAGRTLIMMAMVTSRVHGPWYNVLL